MQLFLDIITPLQLIESDITGASIFGLATYNPDARVMSLLFQKAENVEQQVNNQKMLRAVMYGKPLPTIQLILYRSASASETDESGQNSLYYLFASGVWRSERTIPVVKFLIQKGAEIQAVDAEGRSPLHSACLNHHLTAEVLPLLTTTKIVDCQDIYGNTVLHYHLLPSWFLK